MGARPSASAGNPSPVLVVGVGASAGGLGACQRFLQGAPADQGMAFIIVVHLAPAEESHIAGILQRKTRMEVSQVTGNQRVEPNHVYVIAPATSLSIRDGALEAGAPEEPHYRARPIDKFFSALAADQKEGAVGIVLSGTGNDGSAGLKDIRSAGGLCLVQDPETAEYDGMPRSAIDTGAADTVVPPEEMGEILLGYAAAPRVRPTAREPEQQATGESGEGLQAILAELGKRYRVDFRDYKTGTLQRRTERRIELKSLSGWQGYLEYLRSHPGEVDELYRDILIGVTSFFRDAEEWELLAREIVPALAEKRDDATAVRVWSAGCATGEEAYSLAMVCIERLETAGSRFKLKVFASDASGEALAIARRGLYPASIAEHVSSDRLRRFFRRSGEGFEVERPLRDAVTFAAHDLLSDPPFPHLELVSCRNVLIYLEPSAQERLLELFHFSLRPQGTLWLGASETIGRRTDLFEEVAGKHRIYRSIGLARAHRYRMAHRAAELAPVRALRERRAPTETQKAPRLIEKLVLQRYTSPCVVIGQGLEILYFFGPTDKYLTRPQGEAKLDLLSWVRPELYARLRSGLAEAIEHKRLVTVTGMRLERDTAPRIEIVIEPITSVSRAGGLFLVAFRDLPMSAGPSFAADEAGGEAGSFTGQIQQELQDTRDELRAAVDQLRTATEEHSASHEELLSLNEEFQSSNEELESSKEELQSLNEELTTINRQLEERNEELRSLTSDLNNLLMSANVPTIFLDRELRIRRFTPACATVMRIVPADIGRSLPDIKMQVRDDNMLSDAVRVLAEHAPIEVEVSTEDGRWFLRRILPYRTEEEEIDGVCLTFHEITVQKQAAAASEHARLYAEAIIRTSRTPLLVLDMDHRVVSANAAFYATFQIDEEQTEGRRIYELGNGQWDIPRVRALLEEALRREREIRDYDVDHLFERIGWRSMRLNADVMARNGRPDLILVSIEDVTDLRKAEIVAQSRADELAQDDRRKDEFLAMLGHELRNPLAALTTGLDLMRLTGGGSVEQIRAMMERQTRRMTAMLDQLLDVARVISGKFELTRDAADVAEAAKAAIESVKPMLEAAQHELTVSLPPGGTVLVLGDAVRLAQVMENLLGNAAKYTDNGGRIWLSVDATDDTVKLSVRDTGIGMEPGVLEHVFDLFTQAPASLHRARGGLGLGLALVRSLVQMHGGHVDAFSAGPGKGTEVVVTLPRLRRGRLATPEEEQAALFPVTARRILVVDDEMDAAEALVKILTIQGHEARAVPDGVAALTVVGELKPEVVLLDLGLPKMDGYELAHNLREVLGKRVLLVALTGYQADRARLREAGFDVHLLKPTNLGKLFALLAELDRRGEAATSPEYSHQ
ncbi:MAG TPA: chemotaxis protein CheB [Thermoanaerobaculia bacterium]|nr:chemotaxis protein CheB [Thermoanaerobaculia bacterium]